MRNIDFSSGLKAMCKPVLGLLRRRSWKFSAIDARSGSSILPLQEKIVTELRSHLMDTFFKSQITQLKNSYA